MQKSTNTQEQTCKTCSCFPKRDLFLLLISEFSPFILLAGLYLTLKHHFDQRKHDFRSSRVSTRPQKEGAEVGCAASHRASPKGLGKQGGNVLGHKVPWTESALEKRNRVANQKLCLRKKLEREEMHETYQKQETRKSRSTKSAIKKDYKY